MPAIRSSSLRRRRRPVRSAGGKSRHSNVLENMRMSRPAAAASRRPVSPRKLAANRRNATRSTGPRTAAGKQRSAQNAIRHGMFCREAVLACESPAAFEQVRHQLVESLRPTDAFQLILVERMAVDTWRLRRLLAAERRMYEQQAKKLMEPPEEEFIYHRNLSLETAKRLHRELCELQGIPIDPAPAPRAAPSADELMLELLKSDDATLERIQRYETRLSLSLARSERMLRARQKLAKDRDGDDDAEEMIRSSAAEATHVAHENHRNEPTAIAQVAGESAASSAATEAKNAGESPAPPASQNTQNEPTASDTPRESDAGRSCAESPCHAETREEDRGDETAASQNARNEATAAPTPRESGPGEASAGSR